MASGTTLWGQRGCLQYKVGMLSLHTENPLCLLRVSWAPKRFYWVHWLHFGLLRPHGDSAKSTESDPKRFTVRQEEEGKSRRLEIEFSRGKTKAFNVPTTCVAPKTFRSCPMKRVRRKQLMDFPPWLWPAEHEGPCTSLIEFRSPQIRDHKDPLDMTHVRFPKKSWYTYFMCIGFFSVIPLGLMHDTHYSQNVPKYLNVGSLGLTLAHEILHSLDQMGRGFDANGTRRVSLINHPRTLVFCCQNLYFEPDKYRIFRPVCYRFVLHFFQSSGCVRWAKCLKMQFLLRFNNDAVEAAFDLDLEWPFKIAFSCRIGWMLRPLTITRTLPIA